MSALGYDPYEWFDPEVGRDARGHLAIRVGGWAGVWGVRNAANRLVQVAGVERVSEVPLDRLGAALDVFPADVSKVRAHT